jgi:uncharacterized protein YqjF (DUF2071 family)
MNIQIQNAVWETNERARRRLLSVKGEPLFYADWDRALFIHYEVPAAELQRTVPFDLDLRDGKAYVSLVAFTMRGMRPRHGGQIAAWLFKSIATNEYLNVRTYVRHRGETGIYFLSEWLNNRLSVRLGPGTFGLPYRFGELEYRHSPESGNLNGRVSDPNCEAKFVYEASIPQLGFDFCKPDSLNDFLLERYTAFTSCHGQRRFFRIWHSPWAQTQCEIEVYDRSLLAKTFGWFESATLVSANYSPGASEVWMGRPQRIPSRSACLRHHGPGSFFELP